MDSTIIKTLVRRLRRQTQLLGAAAKMASVAETPKEQSAVEENTQFITEWQNNNIKTLDDFKAHVERLQTNEDKFYLCAVFLELLRKRHNQHADIIEQVFEYTEASRYWQGIRTEAEFNEEFSDVKAIVVFRARERDRAREKKKGILKNWENDQWARDWIEGSDHSTTFLTKLFTLSNKYNFWKAKDRINSAMADRIATPRVGVAKSWNVTTGDIEMASRSVYQHREISFQERLTLGICEAPCGIFRQATAEDRIRLQGFALEELQQKARVTIESAPEAGRTSGNVEVESLALKKVSRINKAQHQSPSKDTAANDHEVEDREPEPTTPLLAQEELGNTTDTDFQDVENTTESDDESEEKVIAQVKQELEDVEDTRDKEDTPARKRRRMNTGAALFATPDCDCSSDVTLTWKSSVMRLKDYRLPERCRLLRGVGRFEAICYRHLKVIGARMGLRVKLLSHQHLLKRLIELNKEVMEGNLGALKVNADTYHWFRKTDRPARMSDQLGPYRFAASTIDLTQEWTREGVLSCFWGQAAADEIVQDWNELGSASVDVFSWWWDEGVQIGDIILAEMDMYRHHLRNINGKPNNGWLRNMFYSIGQQLMRQDPRYYALYVALRPDRKTELISYPYYAKYAKPGDATFFRHIDLNVPGLLEGRGASAIQGTVSLDDEDAENCTEILPGFHKGLLKQWWNLLEDRNIKQCDGYVHSIRPNMYTKEIAEAIGGPDWTAVPCKRGYVRITVPHLLHGATGDATTVRRTMFPWFVGIQKDHEALEVVEGGTWSELSAAHRDQRSPPATPSGLPNKHGAIPFRFPASININGLSPVSDALVGAKRWDSADVIDCRNTILSQNHNVARQFFEDWKRRANEKATEAFELVKKAEMQCYGERSYWYHKNRETKDGISFPKFKDDEPDYGRGEGGEGEEDEDEV